MRFLLVLALTGACASAPEPEEDPAPPLFQIKIDKDATIEDVLGQMERDAGVELAYDRVALAPVLRQQIGSSGLVHVVPPGRVLDTYRAVLMFFELELQPVRGNEYRVPRR